MASQRLFARGGRLEYPLHQVAWQIPDGPRGTVLLAITLPIHRNDAAPLDTTPT
jgi:hypothetical protein